MHIPLTDLVLKNLKSNGKQTQYWDASLPCFGCRVSQAGAKTFNVMIGRKRRLIKIGRYPQLKLAEARRKAHELIDNDNPRFISFPKARDLFIEQHLSKLKPTTCHEQTNLIKRFPFTKSLEAVTLNDVSGFLDGLPPGSARSCFNVLRTFFNWAIANDHLAVSPLKKSPYKPQSRDRLLTDEEVSLIWKESYNHNSFGSIVRLLILSGQRLNQIASLQQSWLQGSQLTFPAYIMKGNTEHTIPLTPTVEKNLVFFPEPFTSHSHAMKVFRAALPSIPHWTLHDFRRYFSSTMARLGTPIHITEQILAHTTGTRSPIQRVYDRHTYIPEMRAALELYEQHLLRIVGT